VLDSKQQQSITVDWTVLTPDGTRVGTVSQSNVVPRGELDGAWVELAQVVAVNGAHGVVSLLTRIGVVE